GRRQGRAPASPHAAYPQAAGAGRRQAADRVPHRGPGARRLPRAGDQPCLAGRTDRGRPGRRRAVWRAHRLLARRRAAGNRWRHSPGVVAAGGAAVPGGQWRHLHRLRFFPPARHPDPFGPSGAGRQSRASCRRRFLLPRGAAGGGSGGFAATDLQWYRGAAPRAVRRQSRGRLQAGALAASRPGRRNGQRGAFHRALDRCRYPRAAGAGAAPADWRVLNMRWPGTLLGAAAGLALASLPGALLAGVLWHIRDRRTQLQSWKALLRRLGWSGGELEDNDLLFILLGRLAKSDGRVLETHIAQTRAEMRRLRLDTPQQRRAIDAFNRGKTGDDGLLLPLRRLR